jgi:hypothetical protein
MAQTIEVYITNKEVVTQTALEGKPLAAAGTVHYCSVKEIMKTEKTISEEEKTALSLVETLARERNLKVQVVNVSSLKGKLKARIKGVKSTPTIIVGNQRMVGVPKREEFMALLEH